MKKISQAKKTSSAWLNSTLIVKTILSLPIPPTLKIKKSWFSELSSYFGKSWSTFSPINTDLYTPNGKNDSERSSFYG